MYDVAIRRMRNKRNRRNREMYDDLDYMDGFEDGIRSVSGTSRGDRRDRQDDEDYNDYNDYGDYGEHLSKREYTQWKRNLANDDGTYGPHYNLQQVMQAAEKIGIKFDNYSKKAFCMAMNMLYSDFCEALKHDVPAEKCMIVCARLADKFLDDEDGPDGDTKLAKYYRYVVEGDE